MPILKRKREFHQRWDIVARRWCERNNLPNGTILVLERMNDGRRVRGDTIIHRQSLASPASDNDTVSDALGALQRVLITDIARRQQRLRLYAPNGSPVSGNTLMGTVRRWEGLATEEDEHRAEYFEFEVKMAATGAGEQIDAAVDMSSSSDIALRAYVRALICRFGAGEVAKAVATEHA